MFDECIRPIGITHINLGLSSMTLVGCRHHSGHSMCMHMPYVYCVVCASSQIRVFNAIQCWVTLAVVMSMRYNT